jgi:hypothetical protein
LLIATAIGSAGMTGVSSVFAVDPPSTVAVTGSLRDETGAPLEGIHLAIAEELPPDGGLAGVQVATTGDGTFAASIERWGMADEPATLTIRTVTDQQIEIIGEACSRTLAVTVRERREVALRDAVDPLPPIDLVATTTVLGEVCDATSTPRVHAAAPAGPAAPLVGPTPPPTDTIAPAAGPSTRMATALLIGFVVGLVAAVLLLVPRPGARRD